LGGISLAPAGFADEPPAPVEEKFTDLDSGIKMLRAEIGQNRRDIVASAMILTSSEGATFWPLYDEYRAAQKKVGDERVKILKDFIAHRDTMSDETAAKLVRQALANDKERVAVKADYADKMLKALPARTVARFFQIDSRLDVAVDAAVASKVPLAQ
jgi:hypothetical protein